MKTISESNKKYIEFKDIDKDLKFKINKIRTEIENCVTWINKNLHDVYESLTEEQREATRKHIDSFKLNYLHDTESQLIDIQESNYRDFVRWSSELEPRKSSKVWINKNGLPCFEMEF